MCPVMLVAQMSFLKVFQRCCCNWSLRNVQDRYVLFGCWRRSVYGSNSSGLPMPDSKFATLPPHFHPKDFAELTETGWEVMTPGFCTLPSSFQGIIPFLFASIVCQYMSVKEGLPQNHRVPRKPAYVVMHMYLSL